MICDGEYDDDDDDKQQLLLLNIDLTISSSHQSSQSPTKMQITSSSSKLNHDIIQLANVIMTLDIRGHWV